MNDKIDKLTFWIGKLVTQVTQKRQSKPFKARMYQGRGRPLNNSGRGDQNYDERKRNYSWNK